MSKLVTSKPWMLMILFVFLGGVQSRAEHTIRGGGGFAESQVMLALQKFPEMIEKCLHVNDQQSICHYTPAYNQRLGQCVAAAKKIMTQVNLIQFKIESEVPNIFPPGGRREFYIAPANQTAILINRSMLYRSGGNGLDYPVSWADIVPMVTRLVAARSQCLTQNEATETGRDLSSIANWQTLSVEFGAANDVIRIYDPTARIRFVHFGIDSSDSNLKWGNLYVQDSEAMYTLHTVIIKSLPCDPGSTATRYALERLEKQSITTNIGRLVTSLTSDIHYVCSNAADVLVSGRMSVTAEFNPLIVQNPRNPDDRAYRFAPEKIKVVVTPKEG